MNRHIVYPGQIPLETDLLNVAKDGYIGLAKLAEAIIGTTPVLSGFAVTPTGPASMTVNIAPGQIYASETIDATDYSSLGTDTGTVIKQGLMTSGITPSVGTFPAPITGGQSINYLIQVSYLSQDQNNVVLPYYNSSNPSMAWNGPDNTGASQSTVRSDVAVVSVVAGAAAATGAQLTPSPSAGAVGAYVVTVANGQMSILSGNISVYSNASFIGNEPSGFSLNGLAPLASPAFTGNPTTPTQSPGDNSGKLASTAYVDAGLVTVGAITGEIKLWSTNTAPSGYLECDGSANSRTTYAALFAEIGVTFGVGDGSTTFNLPDMRGQFARGWDHGAGVDSGRTFGSNQSDGVGDHIHPFTSTQPGGSGVVASAGSTLSEQSANTGTNTGSTVETRPKNVALMFIIKT